MTDARLPHSDTLGSQLGWQLPEAYRSLPRPSSAPDAKTSTACPYTLTTRTIKMLASTMHFSKNNHAPPTQHHPKQQAATNTTRENHPPIPETPHPNNRQDTPEHQPGPFPQDPTV